MKNLEELNSILIPFDNTIFSKEKFSKINSILARLATSISDIQTYVRYDFIEDEGIKIKFSEAKKVIFKLSSQYTNMMTQDFKVSHTGLKLLIQYLNLINGISQYFVFDEEKIMRLYRDYIGKSIKKTVDDSLKKNPKILAALIISFSSIVALIIDILSRFFI